MRGTKPAVPGIDAPPAQAAVGGYGAVSGGREVWLAGNARPVLAASAFAASMIVCLGFVERAMRSGPPTMALAAAVVIGTGLAGLAVAAAMPRLERRGKVLRVRLSPLAPEDVPLEVVECFFFGIVPLGRSVEPCSGSGSDQPREASDDGQPPDATRHGTDDDHHSHASEGTRRATLIMRLAERSSEWRSRPSLAAWGIWRHGAIAFDGLWCERLSPDVAVDLTRRLVAARRDGAVDRSAAAFGEPT